MIGGMAVWTHCSLFQPFPSFLYPITVQNCVTSEREDGTHDVTFLYTYGPGACPASHGLNVARLARLPESVIARAHQKAAQFEAAVLRAHAQAEKGKAAGRSPAGASPAHAMLA